MWVKQKSTISQITIFTGGMFTIPTKTSPKTRSTFDAVPDFTPLHLATALWARAGEDSLKQHEARQWRGQQPATAGGRKRWYVKAPK